MILGKNELNMLIMACRGRHLKVVPPANSRLTQKLRRTLVSAYFFRAIQNSAKFRMVGGATVTLTALALNNVILTQRTNQI